MSSPSRPARTTRGERWAVDHRALVLALQDHVDMRSIDALSERIHGTHPGGTHAVVVDLSAVTRMSTHVLSGLITCLRVANRDRARVAAIVCDQRPVARAVELADLPEIGVFATVGDAVASTLADVR